MALPAEHVYLIPVLSLLVLLVSFMSLLLPETGTEVLEYHSTRSDGIQRVMPARFVCKYASTLSYAGHGFSWCWQSWRTSSNLSSC